MERLLHKMRTDNESEVPKVSRRLVIGDVELVRLQESLEAADGVGRPNCWGIDHSIYAMQLH